jgi:hypothetical protein
VHTWDKDTSPPDNDIAFTVDCQRPILAEILHLGIQDVLAGGFHFASNSFCYTNTFTPVKWKEAVQPRRISGTVIQNASGAPVRSELTNTAIGSVPKGSSTKVTRLYEYEPGPGLPAWCPALVKYYIWADGRPITPKKRPLVYKVLAMELAASPLPDADYMPSAFTGTNVIQGFKIAQGKEFYERGGQWIMVRKLKQAIRLPSWVFPVLAALTLLGAAMALARSARARNQQKQQKGESDAWFI